MKSLLILSALVALTYGRPEAPAGYNYPSPSERYGGPSGPSGRGQGGFRSGQSGQNGFASGSGGSFGSSSGNGFGRSFIQGQFGSGSNGVGNGIGGTFSQGQFGSGSNAAGNGFGATFSQGQPGSRSSGAGFGGSFGKGQSSFGQSGSGGQTSRGSFDEDTSSENIIVNKHVYVHVAPPELEEEIQERSKVRQPPAQKNYKIIFIKTPSLASAYGRSQAPQIPKIEEKTLVYVLVKKPEDQSENELTTPAPTEPSRPEVYFIKYKANKEYEDNQGAQGGQDFSQDDTVEVGAREGGRQEGQNFDRQNGASGEGYSYSSARSSSNGQSIQYGAPNSNGPY